MKIYKGIFILALSTILLVGCELTNLDSSIIKNGVNEAITSFSDSIESSMENDTLSNINEALEETVDINSTDEGMKQEEQESGLINHKKETSTEEMYDAATIEEMFPGYKYLNVAPGDVHQERLPNVVVNIGYGFRYYWSFTNQHSQVYRVLADEIFLQNESTEPVNSDGRYYSQIADVSGTEQYELDRGHIIM